MHDDRGHRHRHTDTYTDADADTYTDADADARTLAIAQCTTVRIPFQRVRYFRQPAAASPIEHLPPGRACRHHHVRCTTMA